MTERQREKEREKNRSYQRNKYASDPKHREQIRRNSKKRSLDPEKKLSDLCHRYGISSAEWKAMLKKQRGRCAICRKPEPRGKGSWHIDHCHKTGRFRGLLCHHCNIALGCFFDSTRFLQKAIDYLTPRSR